MNRMKTIGRREIDRSNGFTLIELLVVISIIALLISVLLPSLSKAKQSAGRTRCASGLRQIAIAIQSYVPDNKEVYPYAGYNGGTTSSGESPSEAAPYISWDDLLSRYLGGSLTQAQIESNGLDAYPNQKLKIYKCAEDTIAPTSNGRSYVMSNPTDGNKGGSLGFGIVHPQSYCDPVTETLRWTTSSIKAPSRTLAMTESPSSIKENKIGSLSGIAIRNPGSQIYMIHGDSFPYMFIDSHVSFMKREATIPANKSLSLYLTDKTLNPGGIWTVNPND